MISKNKIKNWKSCIITWERNRKTKVDTTETPTWFNNDIETKSLTKEQELEISKMFEDFK